MLTFSTTKNCRAAERPPLLQTYLIFFRSLLSLQSRSPAPGRMQPFKTWGSAVLRLLANSVPPTRKTQLYVFPQRSSALNCISCCTQTRRETQRDQILLSLQCHLSQYTRGFTTFAHDRLAIASGAADVQDAAVRPSPPSPPSEGLLLPRPCVAQPHQESRI